MKLEEGLGRKQNLQVVKKVEFGVYLGTETEHVLLPGNQVPREVKIGEKLEVFLYKDSADRLIATVHEPKIVLGEVKALTVKECSKIGAFLDWGLPKDLLLPFKEQTAKVEKGDSCLVSLYVDKSKRLCATMKVYGKLRTDSPYQKDDKVKGIIYDRSDNFGLFVAVDDKYSARIPQKEAYGGFKVGDRIEARVTEVKADGKLELSVREKAFLQMDIDAGKIMEYLNAHGGEIPFTDKADPQTIKREFDMSKNAFKRAAGRLLKEGKIEIKRKSIAIR